MVTVYFTSGTYTEQVATFEDSDLYMECFKVLQNSAEEKRMTVIESIS